MWLGIHNVSYLVSYRPPGASLSYQRCALHIHVNLDITPQMLVNGLALEVWQFTESNYFLDKAKKCLHIGNDQNSPRLKSPWMHVFVAWNILISPQIHLIHINTRSQNTQARSYASSKQQGWEGFLHWNSPSLKSPWMHVFVISQSWNSLILLMCSINFAVHITS